MIQELKTRLLIKRERHRVIRRRVRGIRESDKEIENLSLRPLFYYQQATEVVSFFCLSPEHMLKNHIHISVFSVNIKSTVNTQKCVFLFVKVRAIYRRVLPEKHYSVSIITRPCFFHSTLSVCSCSSSQETGLGEGVGGLAFT